MKFRNDSLVIDSQNPFAQDALDRKPIVEFVETVIAKAEGPMVLALDSPWGTGKTTFVKMLQSQLESKKFRCIYFNAWSVDYATDPLAALVSKINLLATDETTDAAKRMKKIKSIATLVGKRGLIAGVKASTFGVLDLEKEFEAVLAQGSADITSDLFDLVTKEGECLAKFREELEAVVNDLRKVDQSENLVFFIDELDRCRPNFAIELLERIKHLFDVPNIIFVLSIDKSQLEVSTSAIYGAGINAREYLRRFIDLEFQMPQISGKSFVNHLLRRFGLDKVFSKREGESRSDMSTFIDVFCFLAKTTGMSLRTQEQCISRLMLVLDQTPSNYYLYPILAATLIVTRTMNTDLYAQIRSGSASTEELMAWIRSTDSTIDINDRIVISIEAYMNAADSNEKRYAARIIRLDAEATNSELGSERNFYSKDVLRFTKSLTSSYNSAPNLIYLLNKIDLAENFH